MTATATKTTTIHRARGGSNSSPHLPLPSNPLLAGGRIELARAPPTETTKHLEKLLNGTNTTQKKIPKKRSQTNDSGHERKQNLVSGQTHVTKTSLSSSSHLSSERPPPTISTVPHWSTCLQQSGIGNQASTARSSLTMTTKHGTATSCVFPLSSLQDAPTFRKRTAATSKHTIIRGCSRSSKVMRCSRTATAPTSISHAITESDEKQNLMASTNENMVDSTRNVGSHPQPNRKSTTSIWNGTSTVSQTVRQGSLSKQVIDTTNLPINPRDRVIAAVAPAPQVTNSTIDNTPFSSSLSMPKTKLKSISSLNLKTTGTSRTTRQSQVADQILRQDVTTALLPLPNNGIVVAVPTEDTTNIFGNTRESHEEMELGHSNTHDQLVHIGNTDDNDIDGQVIQNKIESRYSNNRSTNSSLTPNFSTTLPYGVRTTQRPMVGGWPGKDQTDPVSGQTFEEAVHTQDEMRMKKRRSRTCNDNFVRLNLRNSAGACRGARNKKAIRKADILRTQRENKMIESSQKQHSDTSSHEVDAMATLDKGGIDPVDDFLDGHYQSTLGVESDIPKCCVHQLPCKLLQVQKNNRGNKGRKFYACSLPRSEQCDFFKWADDTVQATRHVLERNGSLSSFISRQVMMHGKHLQSLTVAELRTLAHKRGLRPSGTKKQILARLVIWVRDEVAKGCCGDENPLVDGALGEALNGTDVFDLDDCAGEYTVPNQGEGVETVLPAPPYGHGVDDNITSSEDELEFFGDEHLEDPRDKIAEVEEPQYMISSDDSKDLVKTSLKSLFGYDCFREGQEWAVRRCLEHTKSILVAPTGFGKSLCYALPAAMMDGLCIVVSPLLSLIQDQIRVMPPRIPAATLSGSMSRSEQAATLDDIIRGRIKILFVSPERLTSPSFQRLVRPTWDAQTCQSHRKLPEISLLCIDEAHCLSQWAHNFRPSYLRISSVIGLIQPKSVLAITATAGPRVVQDISRALTISPNGMSSENSADSIRVMKTNRDNIDVKSFICSTQEERLQKLMKILLPKESSSTKNGCENFPIEGCLGKGCVIVYVWRQRDVEVIAEYIQVAGVGGAVAMYHGGMSSDERKRSQEKFMRGKARICVATVAFGLGINKENVDGVVHMYLSSSPEHYIQEIGRSGRDGRSAIAVALLLRDEVVIRNSLAYTDMTSKDQVKGLLSFLRQRIVSSLSMLPDSSSQRESIHVSLSLHESLHSCSSKEGTVETVLSMLEQRENPLLHVCGIFNDRVTFDPKRHTLDALSKKEPVISAAQRCSTPAETSESRFSSEGESQSIKETDHLLKVNYFGSYTFRVSDCANCMGSGAEPRHVYASLRRLESTGDIASMFDRSNHGRSIILRLSRYGSDFFENCNDDTLDRMATELSCKLSTTVSAGAKKVLDLNYILKEVSSCACTAEATLSARKSESLTRFQTLIDKYFDAEGKGEMLSSADNLEPTFSPLPEKTRLLGDVWSVMNYLILFENSLDCKRLVRIGKEFPEYTALAITKFLHGIALPFGALDSFRQHHLFGTLQTTPFESLNQCISSIVYSCDMKY